MSRERYKKLDTVKKLFAFILDPGANQEEARSMAVQAIRLIEKFDLLREPDDLEQHTAAPENPFDWEELFAQAVSSARARQPPQHSVAGDPTPPPGRAKKPKDPDARNIPITSFATCGECGMRIGHGIYATWSRGRVFHKQCYANAYET